MNIIDNLRSFCSIRKRIEQFLHSRELSPMRRQRLVVLLYATAILEGVIPIIIMTSAGNHPFLLWSNVALWIVGAVMITLYFMRRLSLDFTINTLAVVIQIELSAEIICCATINSPYTSALVMENLFLAVVVVLLAATAYLHYLPYLLSLLALSAYVYSMVVMNNIFMQEFCPVFFFVFCVICLSSNRIYECTEGLETENKSLHRNEEDIQWVLSMNQEQIKAFVALSKNRDGNEDTGKLLDMVGERAKHNIINAVAAYQKQKEITDRRLQRALPMLTASEIEICAMILQDKRQSDICILLGKSASNINSQRSHIRKKLALAPDDDLKEALLARLRNA